MSKLFYKLMVEDIQNNKCSNEEIENLIETFEYTVKKMATTLARKASYDLKDYSMSKQKGINRFTLIVEKRDVCGQEQWWGCFEHGHKKLEITATLENKL